MTNSPDRCSAATEHAPLWVKLFGWGFWVIASPFLLIAGFEIVGATVEHFTP